MTIGDSNQAVKCWLCPLYSFDCDDSNGLDLMDGVQIKQAPNKLKEHIYDETHDLYGRWDDPSVFDWVVFLTNCERVEGISEGRELLRIGFEELERVKVLLSDLVTALRLCKEGKVTPGPLISASNHESQWRMGNVTVWASLSKSDFIHREPKYTLAEKDLELVQELLNVLPDLRRGDKLDSLGVVMRRFHSSYHGDIEDRLIDQMIALESLYIGDDKELTYKLALRTAFFLGRRKQDVFNKVKAAYALRGCVVHGNKKIDRAELERIVPLTEKYLRQSIRKFLLLMSQGQTMKEIRDKLDVNIIKNGRLLALRE